ICGLQFRRKCGVGEVLITDRAHETIDRLRADRCGATIRSRGKRAAVHHGMADLNSSRKSVENDSADFGGKNPDEFLRVLKVVFCALNCGSKVPVQLFGRSKQIPFLSV